ncbi:MAG: NusG domain II-containing protein [Termitinemataceae bacterium]|nr:MAG: NusG domain II-containing protein [Termitinemataceae bacterium]
MLAHKTFDFVIFFASATFCVVAGFFVYSGALTSETDAIIVIKGADGQWVFPLGNTQEISVAGPLGVTVVRTDLGGARVLSSPCKNQTCVACASINENAQWIACLPNRVIITIENSKKEKIDAALW